MIKMKDMSQEQQTALKNSIIEMSCLVAREAEKLHREHPEIDLGWQLTLDALDGEKSWIGNMVSREKVVSHDL